MICLVRSLLDKVFDLSLHDHFMSRKHNTVFFPNQLSTSSAPLLLSLVNSITCQEKKSWIQFIINHKTHEWNPIGTNSNAITIRMLPML